MVAHTGSGALVIAGAGWHDVSVHRMPLVNPVAAPECHYSFEVGSNGSECFTRLVDCDTMTTIDELCARLHIMAMSYSGKEFTHG